MFQNDYNKNALKIWFSVGNSIFLQLVGYYQNLV